MIFSVAEMWKRKQGLSPGLPKLQSVVTVLLESQFVGIYSVLAIVFPSLLSKWLDFAQLAVLVERSDDQQDVRFVDVSCALQLTWDLIYAPTTLHWPEEGSKYRSSAGQAGNSFLPLWWVTHQNRLIEVYRSLFSLVVIHIKHFTIRPAGVICSFPEYHLSKDLGILYVH